MSDSPGWAVAIGFVLEDSSMTGLGKNGSSAADTFASVTGADSDSILGTRAMDEASVLSE